MIKNKYNMFVAFLVSKNTKNYYTQNGLIESLNKSNAHNQWYFKFKNTQTYQEINLDYNQELDNSLIIFINHKIGDEVLKRVSNLLRENLRETDIKRRWDDEEFIVALINTSSKEALK